jgi:hypothetical protein
VFLLNLVQGALQAELDRFFEIVQGAAAMSRMVSKAAFSLARRKLHFGAFVEINRVVIDSFYRGQVVRRWHGLRLLAIDGSTAQLPRTPEVIQWFGVVDAAQQPPCAIGRISALYDVLNRVIIEAQLAPYRFGEQELALSHLGCVEGRDLLLFDRGYPAFWLLSILRQNAIQYCMRVNLNFTPTVEKFVRSGAAQAFVDIVPGSQGRAQCRRRGLSQEPVAVRLVRVDLPSGDTEVLLTSLCDPEAYPEAVFAELYHQRWGIEEAYKSLKCRVEIESFSGKSVHAVMQDFHAKIVSTNLSTLMAHQAECDLPATTAKHTRRVNFSYALSRMKDNVVRLLVWADPRPLLSRLLELLRRTLEPVRPKRTAPRIFRLTARRVHSTYKRCG